MYAWAGGPGVDGSISVQCVVVGGNVVNVGELGASVHGFVAS